MELQPTSLEIIMWRHCRDAFDLDANGIPDDSAALLHCVNSAWTQRRGKKPLPIQADDNSFGRLHAAVNDSTGNRFLLSRQNTRKQALMACFRP